MPQAGRKRISGDMAFFLIAAALFFDFVPAAFLFIPFAGPVLSFVLELFMNPIAAITFGIWLSALGESPMKRKNTGSFLATVVVKFVPFLDELPEWTGWILYTIYKNRRDTRSIEVY